MKTQKPYREYKVKTYTISNDSCIDENIPVIQEHMLELIINGEKWVTFICSPTNLEELALGFLWNENVISDMGQVLSMQLNPDFSRIEIKLDRQVTKPSHFHRTTTGMALPHNEIAARNVGEFSLPAKKLSWLYTRFNEEQKLHDLVGGFHSAALSDGQDIDIIMEDLGRHNCLDKLAGAWLRMENRINPTIMMISGRISSEMILKSVSIGSLILVSRTSPTALAIGIAEKAGICLVGYMRPRQYYIYAHPEYLVCS
ncbi:MAG: formate dehydrogenase accessory sulfurtransferase FdhD [Anaerolineaceae bacterium]|jgi:FdhD protein